MTNLLSKQPVGIDSRWSSTLQRHRLLRQALPWMIEFERIAGGKAFDVSVPWFTNLLRDLGQA